MKFLPFIALGLPAAMAITRHGRPKPCQFVYTCSNLDLCDQGHMIGWLVQACKSIGGSLPLQNEGPITGPNYSLTGYHGDCVCAHGNTRDHTYEVVATPDYDPGTVQLTCGEVNDVC